MLTLTILPFIVYIQYIINQIRKKNERKMYKRRYHVLHIIYVYSIQSTDYNHIRLNWRHLNKKNYWNVIKAFDKFYVILHSENVSGLDLCGYITKRWRYVLHTVGIVDLWLLHNGSTARLLINPSKVPQLKIFVVFLYGLFGNVMVKLYILNEGVHKWWVRGTVT